MLEPLSLWRQRQSHSARETVRYIREAGRGGLFTFLMLFVIVGSYAYGRMLLRLPIQFPFWWVGIAVLLPAVGYGAVRTYMRAPDTVLLLASETRLGPYWRQSFVYSWTLQGSVALVLMLALWPLYQHCRTEQTEPLWLLWISLLVLKAATLAAGWQESRLTSAGHRSAMAGYRWLMTGLALYALLALSSWLAALFLVPAALVYAAGVAMLPKHRIGWEILVQTEQRMQAARRRVFGWFAEIPELQGVAKRRPLWTAAVRRLLPWRQSAALLLLITMTYLRSELFGMVLRLTGAGLFLAAILPGHWSAAVVSLLVFAMTALTLGGLAHAQQLSVWPKLYPIDTGRQHAQACRRIAGVTLQLQSTGFAIWCAGWSGDWPLAAGLGVLLLAGSFLAAARIGRMK